MNYKEKYEYKRLKRLEIENRVSIEKDNVLHKKKKVLSEESKLKQSQKSIEIRRKNKQKALDYLGNKCISCGYNKCSAALEFHHIDPSNKTNQISRMLTSKWNIILEELNKCILLCSNCHAEHHNSNNKQ
jgi:hypothetical protein